MLSSDGGGAGLKLDLRWNVLMFTLTSVKSSHEQTFPPKSRVVRPYVLLWRTSFYHPKMLLCALSPSFIGARALWGCSSRISMTSCERRVFTGHAMESHLRLNCHVLTPQLESSCPTPDSSLQLSVLFSNPTYRPLLQVEKKISWAVVCDCV